jgi:RNA polymerase sigma factor (sigma-70 family)
MTASTGSDRPGREEQRARFIALYECNYDLIYTYLHRRLAHADVADLVAEVFMVAWRRLDRVPPAPEDRLWLYAVGSRVARSHARGLRRRRRLGVRLQAEPREPVTNPQVEVFMQVRAAVERLPVKDREAVRLVLWEQLSHEQAGRVLGCSANAVAVRLHRAKKRLRAELDSDRPAVPYPISFVAPDTTRS